MANSDDAPNSFDKATLSVAEVSDQLPRPGLEVETALDFNLLGPGTSSGCGHHGRRPEQQRQVPSSPHKALRDPQQPRVEGQGDQGTGSQHRRRVRGRPAFPNPIQAIGDGGVLLKAAPRPNKI